MGNTLRIIAFSRFLGYSVGGAELSLVKYLKTLGDNSDTSITAVYCADVQLFRASSNRLDLPSGWGRLTVKACKEVPRFSFYEYVLNADTVLRAMRKIEGDVLYAQGLWAPAAILGFKGRTVRMVRCEHDLNVWGNYHTGWKYVAKSAYRLLQMRSFRQYCADNQKAMAACDEIIANSNYMARQVARIFGRRATVMYPDIDASRLRARYKAVDGSVENSRKAIVMVGDTPVKGVDTFVRLSREFPEERFLVFGRSRKEPLVRRNLTFMPWQADPVDVFKWAKLVLVPSKWAEAYGRVASEARVLGIPVVVSDHGGLPEAVDHDTSCIAETHDDFIRAMKYFLRNGC